MGISTVPFKSNNQEKMLTTLQLNWVDSFNSWEDMLITIPLEIVEKIVSKKVAEIIEMVRKLSEDKRNHCPFKMSIKGHYIKITH